MNKFLVIVMVALLSISFFGMNVNSMSWGTVRTTFPRFPYHYGTYQFSSACDTQFPSHKTGSFGKLWGEAKIDGGIEHFSAWLNQIGSWFMPLKLKWWSGIQNEHTVMPHALPISCRHRRDVIDKQYIVHWHVDFAPPPPHLFSSRGICWDTYCTVRV